MWNFILNWGFKFKSSEPHWARFKSCYLDWSPFYFMWAVFPFSCQKKRGKRMMTMWPKGMVNMWPELASVRWCKREHPCTFAECISWELHTIMAPSGWGRSDGAAWHSHAWVLRKQVRWSGGASTDCSPFWWTNRRCRASDRLCFRNMDQQLGNMGSVPFTGKH